MKKLIPTFMMLFLMIKGSEAQYVTIPDAAFVSWLNTNGFATCLTGNQLDTTCAAVLNATSLSCSSVNIKDLSGIQYFKSLKQLNCSSDSISHIPALPSTLTTLNCQNNQLDSLPGLPAGLRTLNMDNNLFTSLPTLPDTLNDLFFATNRVSTVPALPATLLQLDCSSNLVAALPALPANLYFLDCSHTNLPGLPALPSSLLYLYCSNNRWYTLSSLPPALLQLTCFNDQLTSLPALPSTLTKLDCQNNNLHTLPSLPNSLQNISCNRDSLSSLPTLPTGLQYLVAEYNQLTALPALPSGLLWLYCDNNLLTSLPALNNGLQNLFCQVNLLSSLPALPASLSNLGCGNNLISSVPTLPDSMQSLSCSYNPNLYCLPELKKIFNLDFSNDSNITCVPDYGHITISSPLITTLPICTAGNVHNCTVITGPVANAGANVSICQGGSAVLGGTPTASGGTAPYTYAWSGGAAPIANPTVSPITQTTYHVTVTDALSNSATASITVSVTPAPIMTVSHDTTICAGRSVVLTATGASTYLWSPPVGLSAVNGATVTATPAIPTTYTVTGTSAVSGCSASISVTVTVDTLGSLNFRVYCNGGAYDSMCVVGIGGIPPFNFHWSDGNNTQCQGALAPAIYTVTVTDNFACTATATYNLLPPTQLTLDSISIANSTCGTNNGALCAYVSGGAPRYWYEWSNGATTQCLTGLAPAHYTITVYDGNGIAGYTGCSVTGSVTVGIDSCRFQPNQLSGLALWLKADSGVVTTGSTATQWKDMSGNGVDAFVASGQTAPTLSTAPEFLNMPTIKFDGLSNGLASTLNIPGYGDSSQTVFILSKGYNQSTGATAGLLNVGNIFTGQWLARDMADNSFTDYSGYNGTGGHDDIIGAAPNTGYPYKIFGIQKTLGVSLKMDTNGGLGLIDNFTSGLFAPFTNSPYNVGFSSGDKTLNGEIAEIIVYTKALSDPQRHQVENYLYNKYSPPVNLGPDRTQTYSLCPVVLNPGNRFISYRWSTGATTDSISVTASGTYAVTVVDVFNRTSSSSVHVTFPNTALNANNTYVCPGQSFSPVVVRPQQTSSAYSYLWWNGSTADSSTLSAAGRYYVRITDSLGCRLTSDTITLGYDTVKVQLPATQLIACHGDSSGMFCAVVTGQGGISYRWSNFFTTQCLTHVIPGTYTVTATDILGCTGNASTLITQPATRPHMDSMSVLNLQCYNDNSGSICANVSGGTLNYQYAWSNPMGLGSCNSPLQAGKYFVTVTDGTGCIIIDSATVTQPQPFFIDSFTTTNLNCNGANDGSFCIVTSGGTQPYFYTIHSLGGGCLNTTTPLTCFSNLCAGEYYVIAGDQHSCSYFDSVKITAPAALHIDSLVSTNVTCNGPGFACMYVSGGTPGYSYLWSTGQTTQCISNLSASTYIIRVTDAHHCTITDSAIVSAVSPLTDLVTDTNISCQPGSVCIFPTGGAPAYKFLWNTGDSTQCILTSLAGTYRVTVSDGNNCSLTDSAIITQIPALTVTVSGSDTLHLGMGDTLTGNPAGGTSPYRYFWSNGDSSSRNIAPAVCGTYQVTVQDQNYCTAVGSFSISFCLNEYVWPGDANYDGVVDNNDLLAIGLAYDSTGPVRAGASLTWIGQPATDWPLPDTLPGGVNYKNADCDGNGTVNADDTLAIIQNWGLTHVRSGGMNDWRVGAPVLSVNLVPDTVYTGDTMIAQMILGDSSVTASNVYGLAFTLNYDVKIVDTTKTYTSFGSSWLGSSMNEISISKDFRSAGKIKCAVTRIDHTSRSGAGQIGEAVFVITTDNINGKNYSYYNAHFYISDVTMIDRLGNVLPVNDGMDSTVVGYLPTGIREINGISNFIRLYPNPANKELVVSSQVAMQQIRITDMLGNNVLRNIYSGSTPVIRQQLDISNISSGIYTVEVLTDSGLATRKLIISR